MAKSIKPRVGVLVYTYNRTDDARINMDIIRETWGSVASLKDVKIVHAFNGPKGWWPKKYLEDDLVRVENAGHFQGASDLIDAGFKVFGRKYRNLDYVIVLASDTWLVKPLYVERLLRQMRDGDQRLAACPWGLPDRNNFNDVGMSTDLFIVDLKWALKNRMLPFDYGGFFRKYAEVFFYLGKPVVMLEKLAWARFMLAEWKAGARIGCFGQRSCRNVMALKDRQPVHLRIDSKGDWIRKMYWPKMGLLTHHDPVPKRLIMRGLKVQGGPHLKKFLASRDLSYFNGGYVRKDGASN